VCKNALSGVVVTVNEVADDAEMLTESFLVVVVEFFRDEHQLLESINVVALHFEVAVILIIVINEVNADCSTNSNTSAKELGLVGTGQCDLDRVVLTVLATHPGGCSREDVAGLGGTS